MNIDQVRIKGKPLVRATPADVDALEKDLWIAFPGGYREYVTKLGEGVLGGDFVRIYPPWRIAKELDDWRQRIKKHWFWDKGRAILPKQRALECVIIGDTTNGDEIVFHPTRPGHLFVLPRDEETVFVAGADLFAAIDFACSSGKLTEAFATRDFEPFDSRKDAKKKTPKSESADPEGGSQEALVSGAKEWAKRHGMRKEAQKALREMLADEKVMGVTKKESPEHKTTLVSEALVMEGRYPTHEGYLAVYRVDDVKTGFEIATYTWNKDETERGSGGTGTYAPNFTNIAKLRKSQ